MLSIEKHLQQRRVKDLSNIILSDECCYFLLFNLSGQVVGVQRYSPNGIR
jgi:hypothetical protein